MNSPPGRLPGLVDAEADWSGLSVLVTGLGVSGSAVAQALAPRGARVLVLEGRDGPGERDRADRLRALGATVRLGPEAVRGLPAGDPPDLLVTSPGWRPDQPVLADALARGVAVWGDVELAWRMRPRHDPAPWLTLTGTNGKTTTVRMLHAMLTAAGRRCAAVGNVGTPVLSAVLATDSTTDSTTEPPVVQPDVLAVELSSFQLHWLAPDRERSVAPLASALLNIEPDHLDWHGSFADYQRDKGEIYQRTRLVCAHNLQDPGTGRALRGARVGAGCRPVGFTRSQPSVGTIGVLDGALVDRAFDEPADVQPSKAEPSGVQLATLADVQGEAPVLAPHQVSNALAAATLARAAGAPASAIRDGLRGFRPDPHRIAIVATVDGVRFVDDSKATNPPAAAASLATFESVVWVAGGLLKGADVEELARARAGRLRAAVLIGRDRAALAAALARHAPDVPVVELAGTETDVMDDVVRVAAGLARAGDTVLLAPAAASMDMFRDYAQRGDEFAAAVGRHAAGRHAAGERP